MSSGIVAIHSAWKMIFIIMGVSGAGKTTIGKMLAQKISCNFYDADDFHPAQNIEKMSRGIALTDEDRLPWLKSLSHLISNLKSSAVIACSGLKEFYREILSVPGKDINFIYLKGDQNVLRERLNIRKGHYAQVDLLQSQLEALEEPEDALTLNILDDPEEIVDEILKHYNL